MITHSRSYRLEWLADHLKIIEKPSGRVVLSSDFEINEDYFWLSAETTQLDLESQRLLLQSVFENTELTSLQIPIPGPEVLRNWIAQGARISEGKLQVTRSDFDQSNRAMGCKGASWLERPQPALHVAAIALINPQDQILLAQRPAGKSFAGMWEFPGGKIEEGESPEIALCREVHEELGIHVWNSCLSPLTFVSHAYDGFHLNLLAFACYKFEGQPTPREGQTLKWWAAKDLQPDLMPPANTPLVYAVQDLLG